jgi:hypothetical protein
MAFPARQTTSAYAHDAQKAAALMKKKNAPVQRVTPRLRTAIAAMVFDGQTRSEAAATAKMTDDALRKALLKPAVLAHLNEQIEVLRTSGRPRALRKMIDLIDAKTERIQFEAAKYLDGMDRPSHAVGATQVNVQVNNHIETPGYVIKLQRRGDGTQVAQQIDHLARHDGNALPIQEDVPEDD